MIQTYLRNLEMPQDQVKWLRDQSQILVESLWRDSEDPVSVVLVEAYDQAHPERREATRAKGFADLVGVWRREDYLTPSRDRSTGAAVGTTITDARTLEIAAEGRFKHVQSHTHCGGGACCRMWGSTEVGTVWVEGAKLVFEVESGDKFTKDSCTGLNLAGKIAPRREGFARRIRPNPHLENAPALCWETGPGESVCYNKQQ